MNIAIFYWNMFELIQKQERIISDVNLAAKSDRRTRQQGG